MFKRVWIMSGLLFLPAIGTLASASDLVISEVLPNPVGDESQNEFIEIYNTGSVEMDLGGLFLDDADGGSTPFVIPAGTKIAAGGCLTFYSKETGISLTNTGERARILNADKTVLTEVVYGNAAENYSYTRKTDGTYSWATPPTPENVFVMPVATPTPTPTSTPDPTPTPTVTPTATPIITPTPTPDYSLVKNLVINEMLADPEGNDGANEFIEIYNPNGLTVDLSGFYVDDADGGSTPHLLESGTTIEAGGYLVFYARDTKIALNNTGDSARLLYPDKTALISASVEKTPHEDWSYARKSDGSWAWTSEPTPGEENEFVTPTEEPSPTPTSKPTATSKPPKPTKTPKPTATPKGSVVATDSKTTKNYIVRRVSGKDLGTSQTGKPIATEDLAKEKIGTLVTVRGVVSQVPGAFDARLMYLAGSGVGVFLPTADFPTIALGDTVSVTGVLVKPGKELFISATAAENIVQESAGSPPEPYQVALKDIDDEKIGWPVKTEGTVTKNNAGNLEISADNKTIKVLQVLDAGNWQVGQKVAVTGIVSADGKGLRILASEIQVTGSDEQTIVKSSWLLLFVRRWRTGVGAGCFGCALLIMILVYYPYVLKKLNLTYWGNSSRRYPLR